MMRYSQFIVFLCFLLLFVVSSGCSRSLKQETPSPAADEALRSVRLALESCVRTGKRGDDVENYKQLVHALRPTYREMAGVLEKGFEELLVVPESEVAATARKILAQAQLESDIE